MATEEESHKDMNITSLAELKRDPTQFSTVTVDVFDTLLLRRIHPEDVQFLMHAKRAAAILSQNFGQHVAPEYMYQLRKQIRSIIDDALNDSGYDREADVRSIFRAMVIFIAQRFHLTVEEIKLSAIVQMMIDEELELERTLLNPNRAVIRILQHCKAKGLRLYFVSDMYLSASDIQILLTHFGLADLFDGGFTSSDHRASKGTGRMFQLLQKKLIPGFSLPSNIHIGDNPISDYEVPRRMGINAIHYNTWYHRVSRPLRMRRGTKHVKAQQRAYSQKIYKSIQKKTTAILQGGTSNQTTFRRVGQLMAPALIKYVSYLGIYGQSSGIPIYLLSSEGISFDLILQELGFDLPRQRLLGVNRIHSLRAFAYESMLRGPADFTSQVLSLFAMGEGKESSEDVLESIGIQRDELGTSSLALKMADTKKLLRSLLKTEVGREALMRSLKSSHQRVTAALGETGLLNERRVILADVGGNGTIQILLEQLFDLIGHGTSLRGIYLGRTGTNIFGLKSRKQKNGRENHVMRGVLFDSLHDRNADLMMEEIWEYVLTFQFAHGLADSDRSEEDESAEYDNTKESVADSRNQVIWQGILDIVGVYLNQAQMSPDVLFNLFRDELASFFNHPTREQVLLFGSLGHDVGFGSDLVKPLVELHHSRRQVYLRAVRHPRQTYHWITYQQYWTGGFLSWYQLHGAYRILSLGPVRRVLKRLLRRN